MKTRNTARYLRSEGNYSCRLISIPAHLLWESVIVENVNIADLARLLVALR